MNVAVFVVAVVSLYLLYVWVADWFLYRDRTEWDNTMPAGNRRPVLIIQGSAPVGAQDTTTEEQRLGLPVGLVSGPGWPTQ